MHSLILILLFGSLLVFGNSEISVQSQQHQLLSYLQSESSSLSSSHKSITDYLHSKKIPVNGLPGSLRIRTSDRPHLKIAESTPDKVLECRISLSKIPVGKKCIAPCACSGSQQWITFAEFNRLRRKEPMQWKVCRTCQQKLDVDSLVNYSGISGNLIGLVLDNLLIFRSIVGFSIMALCCLISFPSLVLRFLVSKAFWQQYLQWSRITHLPLVLKFWGGKLLIQYLATQYLKLEQVLVQYLAEIETQIVEPNLPLID